MIVRALDGNGDWTFGNGIGNYLSGQAAVGQKIKTRLQCFLGDCFFDTGAGIDWITRLGQKDQTALQLDVRAVILNTQGVTRLLALSTTRNAARALTVSYAVQTVYSVSPFYGQTTVAVNPTGG